MQASPPLPSLPKHNFASYPKTLTEVTPDSIREVMLHYANGTSTSPRHHMITAGLEMMLRVSSLKDVGLRNILERAGYGFSRFYKLWPNLETYHYDVWRFGLACHSLSELEHLRQLGGESLEAFADTVARHLVLAHHHVSPLLFKQIMRDYADGDMMKMLSHTPEHINNTLSMFLILFPQHAEDINVDSLHSFGWMAATYLYTRILDPNRSISDEDAIATIKSQLLTFQPGFGPASERAGRL